MTFDHDYEDSNCFGGQNTQRALRNTLALKNPEPTVFDT